MEMNADGSRAEYACLNILTPSDGTCFFHAVSYAPFSNVSIDDVSPGMSLRTQSVSALMEVVHSRLETYSSLFNPDHPPTFSSDHDIFLSMVEIIFNVSHLLDDEKPYMSKLLVEGMKEVPYEGYVLPEPQQLEGWAEGRRGVLLNPYTWAYHELMHQTAKFIPHNITIISFPYAWYKGGGERVLDDASRRGFGKSIYVQDVGRGYSVEKEEGLPPTTIFIQYVGMHYQSIVFCSTRSVGDAGVVHSVPTWERHLWVARLADFWGFPESARNVIEAWRTSRSCQYPLGDGRLCAHVLGHDESIAHGSPQL